MPSPLKVAAKVQEAKARESPEALEVALRSHFPLAVWTAEQAGSVVAEDLAYWTATTSAQSVADALDEAPRPGQFLAAMADALAASRLPLVAALVLEAQLCAQMLEVAPYIRSSGRTLEEELRRLRDQVARSAFDAAFAASWKRRTVFSRALQIARTYMHELLESYKLNGQIPPRALISRFGMSTVLSARFAMTSQSELEEAALALLDAHEHGADTALSYYVECCLRIYDYFGDIEALDAARRKFSALTEADFQSSTWFLNGVELWMKLAGTATTRAGQVAALRMAKESLRQANLLRVNQAEESLRYEMHEALLMCVDSWIADKPIDLNARGLQFPFGLRSAHVELPSVVLRSARSIIEQIERSEFAGEFVYRDVLAELTSYLARNDALNERDKIALLRRAIAIRSASRSRRALKGSRAELANAEDRLLLAQATSSRGLRREAVEFLALESTDDSNYATRLTVLAKDIETHGLLAGPLITTNRDLSIAIRNGDSGYIYEVAARLAIHSPDVMRINLGGRGGVIALRDTENSNGHTFVFKRMSPSAVARDADMTRTLQEMLMAHGKTDAFGFIEHLSVMSSAVPGVIGTDEEDVVSIRRFSSGETLSNLIAVSAPDLVSHLRRTVDYLAFIHAQPSKPDLSHGLRKTLWATEVGRWLRALYDGESRSDVFAAWWACFEGAPSLVRRDAHAMNWLVESTGKILAVDLEAVGARPLGYELAQLIEDIPMLALDDWISRDDLTAFYVKQLRHYGLSVEASDDEIRRYVGAGMLARALRMISRPDADQAERMRGGQLLASVKRRYSGSPLGDLAANLDRRWSEITGVAIDTNMPHLAQAERRRISRAMSYHLRHNPRVPASRDGWVHVEELTELLRQNGHRVTSSQVLMIAGALGEPRFDKDGDDIRAAYGHSVARDIQYLWKKPPKRLYHATPVENLGYIFGARTGLVRGRRQWVHLTDDCSVALQASRRQGRPVVVLLIKPELVKGLVYATGHTWLAPTVPADVLEVMPSFALEALLTERVTGAA